MVFGNPRALNELGLSGTHMAGEAAIIDNGQAAALEGYIHNVVGFACVELIANAAASVRREIKERGKIVEVSTDHIAGRLLARPNAMQDGAAMIGNVLRDYLIFGAAFAEGSSVRLKNFEGGRMRPSFWRIPPMWVNVIPGKYGMPVAFRVDHGKTEKYPVSPGTGDCDIIFWKRYHPTEHWKVVSPVVAAGRAVNTHNHASDIVDMQMRKGGLPVGFLSLIPEAAKSHAQLSREQQQDMQDLVRRATEDGPGPNIPVLHGYQFNPMGLGPREMDFVNGLREQARGIAMGFGVPPQLLGLPDSQTYSNFSEARRALYRMGVLPVMNTVLSQFAFWFSQRLFTEIEIYANEESVPEIMEARAEQWAQLDGVQSLTINEKRQMMGMKPVDGGDEIMVSGGTMTLDDAQNPPDFGEDPSGPPKNPPKAK